MKFFWVILNLIFSVCICSIPIILFGWLDRNKDFVGRITRFWAQWMIWSTGIHYDVSGYENLQYNKQYIFMCNHESALDIIFGVAAIPNNIIFLAKKELFKIPVFGWALKAAGMIKIDRQNPLTAKESVDAAVDILLQSNFSTLIYPEGTRSENCNILPFKKGGFILAIRSQIPVVPITILGAGDALPKGSYCINTTKIKIIFGQPILTEGMDINDKDILLQNCRNIIEQNMKDLNHNDNAQYKLHSA